MRTTLDIDNDVLQAAKDLAVARNQTAGQVLSALARTALTRPTSQRAIVVEDGLPYRAHSGGVVSSEIVKRLDLESELTDLSTPRV
jgi:hypothetical protein